MYETMVNIPEALNVNLEKKKIMHNRYTTYLDVYLFQIINCSKLDPRLIKSKSIPW